MKINVFRCGDVWRADPVDLPGTPPNGMGRNPHEAVGSLLFAIRHERAWRRYGWPEILIECEGDPTPREPAPPPDPEEPSP